MHMLQDALLQRYRIFVLAATIAAHANTPPTPSAAASFRQRDVRFYIELFSNWMETALGAFSLPVQNTQVQRFLSSLVSEGYARRLDRGRHPGYRLTRTGLIELTSQMVTGSVEVGRWQFLFLFYFIKNYRQRIVDLVRREGQQFPPALRLELEAHLDARALLDRELKSVEAELQRLDARIEDARQVSELLRSKVGKQPFPELVREVERLYPYELNNQKPLHALIAELPEELGAWELQHGAALRSRELWQPGKRLLQAYQSELRALSSAMQPPKGR